MYKALYKALYMTHKFRLHEIKYIVNFSQAELHSPNYTLDKIIDIKFSVCYTFLE